MTEIFFISDTHFLHRGILRHEPEHRPFATIEEHDEAIVSRWNSVVGDIDIVYHLGDFTLTKRAVAMYAPQLRGRKRLVAGNHDSPYIRELTKYFEEVYGVYQYESVILSHVPVHPQQLEHRFFANVHGHLHSKKLDDWRYLNVGCEHTNLTPITLEEVYSRIMIARQDAIDTGKFKYGNASTS